MADSSNSKTFKADDTPTDTELWIDASLDLTGQSGGMLYFNKENNYNYTRNWYNYGKLHNIGDETIINEVVSYAAPTLVPNTLDTTKTYSLPSTSLNASWASRIEISGDTSYTAGFSGTDAVGNTYVIASYSGSSVSYNENGTSAGTKSSPGGIRVSLTKYDSSGVVQWISRITCPTGGQNVIATCMTTGSDGTTYIIGTCSDTSVQFENSSGTVILTTPLKQYTFMVAYSSLGVPLWATYFGPISRPSITIHEASYSIYVTGFAGLSYGLPDEPQLFYIDLPSPSSPSSPGTPIFSLGRYAAYGTTALTTVARSAGGVATLTFSSNVTNLGLYVNTRFSLLGLTNDNGTFNVSSGLFTITSVTTNTISYTNATGTMPYASTVSTGTPILAIYEPYAGINIIRFNSTSGSFSWATYVDGYVSPPFDIWVNTGTTIQNPYITTDYLGNLFVSASYFYIRNFKNAATPTQPLITDSNVTTPPLGLSNEIKVYGEDRNWVDITCEDSGSLFVALDRGGYIYFGTNSGTEWIRTAFPAEWNCSTFVTTQWLSPGYFLVVAGVYDGLLYYYNDFSDIRNNVTWNVCNGEGSTARKWVAIASSTNSTVIALAENDKIYYSTNGGITWSASNSPIANWIDADWTNTDPSDPYDPWTGYWVALVKNGQAYRSTDGINWTLISGSPSLNWKAIAGYNSGYKNVPEPNYFYAVVEYGNIYVITSSFQFVIVDYNIRKYSDISIRGGWGGTYMVACVDGGSVYVSSQGSNGAGNTKWLPITIPGDWSSIKMDYFDYDKHFAVTDKGGKIYVMNPFDYFSQTTLFKYNLSGVPQWATYILTPETGLTYDSSNHPCTVTTQPNGNIILHGWAGVGVTVPIYFYSSQDFENPVKIQLYEYVSGLSIGGGTSNEQGHTQFYLVCYSNDGIPLWNNKIRLLFKNYSGDSLGDGHFNAVSTDSVGNIYCVGTARHAYLYNPDDQLVYSDGYSQNTAILVKYYPNGYVQSFTRFIFSHFPFGGRNSGVYGVSVKAVNSDVYVTGRLNNNYSSQNIEFRNSPGNVTGITEPVNSYAAGVYIVKYTSNVSASINFPIVPYNNTFDPIFTIGGSTQLLILGSTGYANIEKWGGQTGLDPSAMTLADINTGTICYLGHEPGYSIPLEYGIQSTSPINYRYLSVLLGESTFPENDPQPVTFGTIPYGYLAINILYPNYASGLQFNNSLNNGSNLILYAMGTVLSNGLVPSGVSSGDKIRVMIYSETVDRFVNLTVKDMIASSTSPVVHAGIRFEENTRFLCNVLGTTTTATAILLFAGNLRYLSAYFAPALFQSGSLNVFVQMYPKHLL
jgi:hypothetical protein